MAKKLLDEASDDPLDLARTRIFVPNRRAARSLSDAFLRLSGGGLLLPQVQPLGDLDALDDISVLSAEAEADLPPAVGAYERLLALAPLVSRWGERTRARAFSAAEVLTYARELSHQVDQFDYAGVTLDALKQLARENYPQHWKQVLEFLDIIFVQAPDAWIASGKIGPAARRVMSIQFLAAAWRKAPPAGKILVAGSTGSIPAVADLMHVICRLPQGAVVLPALDRDLDEVSWKDLAPNHAQYALKILMDTLGVARAEVDAWLPDAPVSADPARSAFVNMALWSAPRTSEWRTETVPAAACAGLRFLEASTDQEEARAIALHVRNQVRQPEKTIAIVTADRPLARRIAATLARFDIAVDDSAGIALTQTPPAVFLRQLARTAISRLMPVDLLALLKHPLCGGGVSRLSWLEYVRILDKHVLRGLRPAAGMAGLQHAAATALKRPEKNDLLIQVNALLAELERHAAGFFDMAVQDQTPALELLHAHILAAENLAGTDAEKGAARLWRGEAGQELSQILGDIAASLPPDFMIACTDYAVWFEELLNGKVVRPRYGKHPRVSLLSPIEARLQRADVMILAGLNEGSWPPAPQIDPFLADHMRKALKLPTSEFRLGQSAHDFAQSLGAETVLLTRARKSAGAPALASRFWLRLKALGGAALEDADDLLLMARGLDQSPVIPVQEPLPTPPLSARPPRISISDMALWRQNPYAFYAKKILALSPLDDIDLDPGPLDRGTNVHGALELFFKRPHAERTLENLLRDGETAFSDILDRPLVRAFWWPRFVTLAEAIVESDDLMVGLDTRTLTEASGGWNVPGLAHPLEITGRADRIDISNGNQAVIYDYKSGGTPTAEQIRYARLPQMALLALMAENGSFADAPALSPQDLSYVKIKGRLPDPLELKKTPGKFKLWDDVPDLMAKTAAVIKQWAEIFENPAQPYKFLHAPDRGPGHEYDLLARVDEWRGQSSS